MICENCGLKIEEFKDYYRDYDNLPYCNEKCSIEKWKSKIKNFKNFDELTDYIKANGCEDYFKVDGVLYTMEEFDHDGKEVKFANKKHNKGFIVETANRYGQNKYSDAVLLIVESWDYFRIGIIYLE